MKVIFDGYYGMLNSGDDSFMEVAAWGAMKFWKCDSITFLSNQKPILSTPVQCINRGPVWSTQYDIIKNIFKNDVFVSAGGSTFHSKAKPYNPKMIAYYKKKYGFKGANGAIGVSLGPYKSVASEKSVIKYLQSLDFVALRDDYSYNLAESYNLNNEPIRAFDLAALLPIIYTGVNDKRTTHASDQSVIGISICNYERYTNGDLSKEEKRNNFIKEVLKNMASIGKFHFKFFIFNGHIQLGDESITREILDELLNTHTFSYEIIPYSSNVEESFNEVSLCSFMLSTRLHASIFACYAQVPFFLVEYHRKCTDFLNDVGQDASYRIQDGELSPILVAEKIADIVTSQNYIPPIHLAETQSRSMLNFTDTAQYFLC